MQGKVHCSGQLRDGKPCTDDVEERYSLGITAGLWCSRHWETSGYRKDGPEGFDTLDAGEAYEPDGWYGDEW